MQCHNFSSSSVCYLRRADWGWIAIVHCGRSFNAVIKPLLSNIKYCGHCWWTSRYCWSLSARQRHPLPGNQALTENNFSVQSDVTDVRSNGTLQHQFVFFLIFRISSVKIESNPTKRWIWSWSVLTAGGDLAAPEMWVRSHPIHFDIISDCEGLFAGAEMIRDATSDDPSPS